MSPPCLEKTIVIRALACRRVPALALLLVSLGILVNGCSARQGDAPVSQSAAVPRAELPVSEAGGASRGEAAALLETESRGPAVAPGSPLAHLSDAAEGGHIGGLPKKLENSIGMQFVLIPSGEFEMGAPADDKSYGEVFPQHHVRISKPFYLGVYEVTQAEYHRVTGTNPASCSKNGAFADNRVYRGGVWAGPAWACRSDYRGKGGEPSDRFENLGFRVAFSPAGP